MKKTFLLSVSLIILPFVLFAVDRVVVVEIATGTWCPNCPAAARGADDLAEEHPDKVLVVEYHGGSATEPFMTSETQQRISYYGISGYPTAVFDGLEQVIGGSYGGNMFFYYNAQYNARAAVEPPLSIDLKQIIDAFASTSGTLEATVTNVSEETVSGYVRFTVTESHIPYTWQGMDNLDFVARDMLPDAGGQFVSLAPGEDIVVSRDFVIDEGWPYFTEDENIEFGCFVQGVSKEIYQGAVREFGDTATVAVEDGSNFPFALKAPTIIRKQDFIELSLDAGVDVDISLYNSIGRKLETLHKGVLDAGAHRIEIKTDALPAGTYFIKVTAGVCNQICKLLILR